MSPLTKIEMRTIEVAVRDGFTFTGDSHFSSAMQGVRVIRKLVGRNILHVVRDGNGIGSVEPTQIARDIIRYGSLEAALS